MPVYRCTACDAIVKRLLPTQPGHLTVCICWRGVLRLVTAMHSAFLPAYVQPGLGPSRHRIPNVIMRNVSIVNCGTGIKMDGGHADIEGLDIIDTPVGMDLNRGATVHARKVTYRAGR